MNVYICGLFTSSEVEEDPSSSEQKQQEPFILLSDSSEQVMSDSGLSGI